MTSLILHHYPQSPVAHKVRMALGIAGASWQSVEIPRLPPKPLLVPLTAGYRRTPVLQIGADIYCDSQNIAQAIDQSAAPHRLFPDQTYGMAMMISNWAETTLFDLSVRLVLTHALGKVPEEFIRDRGSLYFEPNWTEASLRAALPSVMHELRASLGFVEAHLGATMVFILRGISLVMAMPRLAIFAGSCVDDGMAVRRCWQITRLYARLKLRLTSLVMASRKI